MWNINWCIWTNIHPWKYQRRCGKTIFILPMIGEKYCGNYSYLLSYIHFLLFCDHRDSESEKCEIYMSISQLIYHKKCSYFCLPLFFIGLWILRLDSYTVSLGVFIFAYCYRISLATPPGVCTIFYLESLRNGPMK